MPKITALPAAAAITTDDLFAIVDNPGGVAVTQKATGTQVQALTAQVYTGAAPPAAPNDPTRAALWYPTGGGSLLQWDLVGAAWV